MHKLDTWKGNGTVGAYVIHKFKRDASDGERAISLQFTLLERDLVSSLTKA